MDTGDKQALRAMMPLSEPMYYIMLAFVEPLHGYGAMRFVERLTGGRLVISPGTLYGVIKKLLSGGLIEQAGMDGRRKQYVLTPRGRLLLGYEFRRIADMAQEGSAIIFTMRRLYGDQE